MTKDEAKKFKYYSAVNAKILRNKCPECEPYKDWFTYKRWEAQSEQVARGQKGTRLTTYVETEVELENGKTEIETHPVTATVFCKHQLA